jgi:uncharacterized membrane protein
MELYEELKKDLDETHDFVSKGWKSLLRDDILLLVMMFVSFLLFGTASVLNFCEGDWHIVLGVYYIILMVLMICLCAKTVHRMRDTKEQIKANDMWYENELNRLNNLKKESEDEDGNENCQSE